MDYQKHYDQLIHNALTRINSGYTERHHILPRCLGGCDDVNNLVDLTPEEHYVAHQLLVRLHPDNPKLLYAAIIMTGGNRPSNKIFGWLKRRLSEIRRNGTSWNKGRSWTEEEKERLRGTRAPLSNGHKQAIKEAKQHISAATRDKLRKSSTGRKLSAASIAQRTKSRQKNALAA